jgi:TatA/E family protein of Tat protein translocase
MGPLGIPELVIIFIVALIVFGPRKLPELGRSLGKSLSEFKRASNELRSTLDEEIRLEDRRAEAAKAAAAAATASNNTLGDDGGTGRVIADASTSDNTPSEQVADTVARGGVQGA